MRILLIEDDTMIGAAVSVALKDAAYSVDWVKDGVTASQVLGQGEHQCVLLDLGLPGRDGLEVLRRLRLGGNKVPVIVITARDGVEDRIKGLDFGADDYLLKPFNVNELLARLRAVIRRQGGQAAPLLSNGRVTLDPASHQAQCGDTLVTLSAREFALLHALLLRPGAILARAELEARIYGWNEEVESNAVDFLIHGIRKNSVRIRSRMYAGRDGGWKNRYKTFATAASFTGTGKCCFTRRTGGRCGLISSGLFGGDRISGRHVATDRTTFPCKQCRYTRFATAGLEE